MHIQSREVSWNVSGIETYGTLTLPQEGSNLPSVILLAGSGPTDRNWCSPILPGSNGSGRLIAEKLAENGIATLRYDKAGSGPHVNENIKKLAGKINMQHYVDELSGAVSTLTIKEGLKPERMFALTSSEGAIHAVNYQLKSQRTKFRGLILTGPPGRSVRDIAKAQLLLQMQKMPDGEEIMKRYDFAISEFLSGKPVEYDPIFPKPVKLLLMSLESLANLPFSRELWVYRLGDFVGKVKESILIVIGKKDIQVSWKDDGNILKKSLSENEDASFFFPENANHILKHEDLPLQELTAEYAGANYNSPERDLDEESANTILAWIKKRT